MNFKDIAVRAAKTAVQVFLGYPVVELAFAGDGNALEAAALAAAAAAVSVVMNALRDWSEVNA